MKRGALWARTMSLPPNRWLNLVTILMGIPRRDGRLLTLSISHLPRIPKTVVAIEQPNGTTIQGALEDHAHVQVGTFPTIGKAKTAARAFADQWLAGAALEKCKCGPIELPK